MRSLLRAGLALVRRPGLWPTAIRQARRTAPPGWWRRAPFAPFPPADYRRFRLLTQYGDAEHPVDAADLVRFLEWCRAWDRAA